MPRTNDFRSFSGLGSRVSGLWKGWREAVVHWALLVIGSHWLVAASAGFAWLRVLRVCSHYRSGANQVQVLSTKTRTRNQDPPRQAKEGKIPQETFWNVSYTQGEQRLYSVAFSLWLSTLVATKAAS